MKKQLFKAIKPDRSEAEELEGRSATIIVGESGDEVFIPCFLYKRAPFWYVFEHRSGLAISAVGKRTIKEALEYAKETCEKHGAKETLAAIERAKEVNA